VILVQRALHKETKYSAAAAAVDAASIMKVERVDMLQQMLTKTHTQVPGSLS
jgi:hypothetical protein